MLRGSNTAALRNADGAWEVIQFETATLVGPRTYRLSRVLRAQVGTDPAMSAGFAAGARFVVLDAAVTPVELAAAEIGLPLEWRYGPWNRDIGEESFAGRVHAFRGVGHRPLSPVHIRGHRSAGDLTLSWIRRTRTGGDSWDAVEVPIGEESERYEVDILDGDTVVRTITTTSPEAIYTAAEQVSDFGSPQSTVGVRVHQTNAAWGRGSPANAVV